MAVSYGAVFTETGVPAERPAYGESETEIKRSFARGEKKKRKLSGGRC